MKKDTASNKIEEIIPNCDCGLTGGCHKCNPYLRESFIGCISDEEAEEMKKKIKNWKQRFNNDFNEQHKKLFPLTYIKYEERIKKGNY